MRAKACGVKAQPRALGGEEVRGDATRVHTVFVFELNQAPGAPICISFVASLC